MREQGRERGRMGKVIDCPKPYNKVVSILPLSQSNPYRTLHNIGKYYVVLKCPEYIGSTFDAPAR